MERKRLGDGLKGGEPFKLLKMLGAGGFGTTWKAEVVNVSLKKDLGEIVAIKIPLNKEKEGALIQDLIMAGSIHSSLLTVGASCPNIVRYLGFNQYDGQWVMVTEFIPDGDLRKKIGKIGSQETMHIDDACNIVEGILDGLEVLHAAHIVHRDIKPENILMDGNVPKITDFGLSRILANSKGVVSAVGTLDYMSPELLGGKASFSTDIWSVAVTLYEMLSGELPFQYSGSDNMLEMYKEITKKITEDLPRPIPEFCPDVSNELWKVIERGLSKDPKDRYQTPAEMREALRKCRIPQVDEIEQQVAQIREIIGSESTKIIEQMFIDIVNKHPKDSRAYLHLGEYYLRAERLSDALDNLKRGLVWDNNNALIHWNLAQVYQKQGKRKAAQEALRLAISSGLDKSLERFANILLRSLEVEK